MKRIIRMLISTRATLWLLLVFAMAMAAATFVEEYYDTATAFRYVYRAKWFECIQLLLVLNFIGNIKRYNLLSRRKLAGFLFHSAFIVILLGAGVTRYFGYEGLMHIRENESSNRLISEQKVLKMVLVDGTKIIRRAIPLEIKDLSGSGTLKQEFKVGGEEVLQIQRKAFLNHVAEEMVEHAEGGVDYIKMNVLDQGKEADLVLADHEISQKHSIPVSFNSATPHEGFRITEQSGKYLLHSSLELKAVTLPEMTESILLPNTAIDLAPNTQYSTIDNAFKFIFQQGYKKAKKQWVATDLESNSFSALLMEIKYKNNLLEIPVFIDENGMGTWQHVRLDKVSMLLGYGEKEIHLPFSLHLNDFSMERYPGSNSPSSYASEVTIIDKRANQPTDFRIYMNHILDYDGFRFFQSSYDKDEKGTVLSVNHDFWGTWITYLGYFLLALGFAFTLFNKNSRFQQLSRSIREVRRIRMQKVPVILLLLLGFGGAASASDAVLKPVSPVHIDKLSKLIVQTYDGRSEPLHTLSYEVMHKIARKDVFELEGKGRMDAMQVMMDMLLNPQYWKSQKIIYVREKSVASQLGISGKYASYLDLVDSTGTPKLSGFAEEAFRKKGAEQNSFDKEVIKIGERLEILMMLTQGSLLRIFPEPVSNSKQWISWDNPAAQIVVNDVYHLSEEMQIPQFNYNNLMGAYLSAVYLATSTNDYSKADKILEYIHQIQRSSNLASVIPSENQVVLELFYNKTHIFSFLRNVYGLLAVILLILAYAENFREKRNKWISGMLNVFLLGLALAFLYHTFGLVLRWYLAGHAPWSNGYEALLLIGWAGILAGFTFIRYSKIPLAATALLAFFTLMTAGHSSYDPQITNLQPVLKSYWLIIHVATLTISYGFLGLAFILGLFTLTLYLFKNRENETLLNLRIRELSNINEMNVTIGLILATLGTFLGGVWANESWGRYWGWDAKETWALIITIVYSIVVHLRLVDAYRGDYFFSVGAVVGFGSVLMTFIGVNYYLSKGMHSYGGGETPVFPLWAWLMIVAIITLIVTAWKKEKAMRNADTSALSTHENPNEN